MSKSGRWAVGLVILLGLFALQRSCMPEIKDLFAPNRYGHSFNDKRTKLGLSRIPDTWKAVGSYEWAHRDLTGSSKDSAWIRKYMILNKRGNAVWEIDELLISSVVVREVLAVKYEFRTDSLFCLWKQVSGSDIINHRNLDPCSCTDLIDSMNVNYSLAPRWRKC